MAGLNRTGAAGAAQEQTVAENSQGARSMGDPPRVWGIREVMDIRQASEYLGISPDSLYKYASENFIPAFKLGNRWRFKRSLLERWIEQQSSLPTSTTNPKNIKSKQKKPVSRAR